jgi:hypothetical protein
VLKLWQKHEKEGKALFPHEYMYELLKSGGALAAQLQKPPTGAPPPPSRPFDIREYTEAARQLDDTLGKVDEVLKTSHTLLGASEWDRRIEAINQAADGRMKVAAERSRELVDLIFLRVCVAIGFLCTLVIVWLVISHMLRRRFHAMTHGQTPNGGSK